MAGQQIAIRDRAVGLIDALGQDLINSLPSTVNPTRFTTAFVNLAVHNPSIFLCTADSLRRSLLKCAADGLVPDGRLAAIVSYNVKNKDGKWEQTAQYIPMYQGLISRARELGEMFSVTANLVYQHDVFQVDESDPEQTVHKRPPLNQDRGAVVGAYVIFRDNEKRVIHREIMDLKALQKTQAVSRAKDGPWKTWTEEMMRKTVIRRGAKYIPMSAELRTIVERDDELADLGGNGAEAAPSDYNPLTGKVIEHEPAIGPAEAPASVVRPSEEPKQSRPAADAPEEPSGGGGAAPTVAEDDGSNPPAPQAEMPLEAPPPPQQVAKKEAKPGAARDKALSILHKYTAELFGLVTQAEVRDRSNKFWDSQPQGFPDGTKLGNYATEIFQAHMARVQGKGSPGEVDAIVKRFEAEVQW